MIKKDDYILVLGTSIIDIIGFSNKTYTHGDSIPGAVKISQGGVCRNVSENLAKLNVNTLFISTIGDDINGHNILKHANDTGFNMEHSLIVNGKRTATYMAILNENGEMESAIVDIESLNLMTKDFIDSKDEIFSNAKFIVVDSDNPELLEYILKKYSNKSKFILDPVSANKAFGLKHLIKYFHTIKPNKIEAEALCGFPINNDDDLREAGRYFSSLGVKNVFISLDIEGIYYLTENEEGKIACNDVIEVKNVTGAGDSFVAGIGYGYMNKLDITDTLKYAISMSIATIMHEDTINPKIDNSFIQKYIENITWLHKKF